MRFMSYTMGDDSAGFPPPSDEMLVEMGAFIEEMTKSGALLATGAFAPSREAIRVQVNGDQVRVLDGPFAEAKELIGGWALVELPSQEAAIEMSQRFLKIVGGGEVTIRRMEDGDEFS